MAIDQFDVSFLPNEEPRLLATRTDPAEAQRWRLKGLDVAFLLIALRCWHEDGLGAQVPGRRVAIIAKDPMCR